MKLFYGDNEGVSEWVASRIPQMHGQGFGNATAIGVVDSMGVPVAGVVFHDYQPYYKTIQVSFAAERSNWLTSRLATDILSYPFGQLGLRRITSLTPRKLRPARTFLEKFGFKREAVLKYGFGDDDTVVSRLLAEEWATNRFNRNAVDGQALRSQAGRSGRDGQRSGECQSANGAV